MEKTANTVRKAIEEFNKEEGSVSKLSTYLDRELFVASEYQKHLEQNLRNYKVAWTDVSSVNAKLDEYRRHFDDPERMPYWDEKER